MKNKLGSALNKFKIIEKTDAEAEAKKAAEEAAAAVAAASNETDVKQPEEDNKPKAAPSIPASQFSSRIGGIYARMYRLILSADLQTNICQIECGENRIASQSLKPRDYYDNWIKAMKPFIYESDVERFAQEFSRPALSTALNGSSNGFRAVYCMNDTQDPDLPPEYNFYEFAADKIPDAVGGAVRVRCIIYIRRIKERPNDSLVSTGAGVTQQEDYWNEIRINKLIGGKSSVFFEYDTQNDIMTLHKNFGDSQSVTKIDSYLRTMGLRSNQSVFHGDSKVVENTIKEAAAGHSGSAEIKYRLDLTTKEPVFRIYRLICAPADDSYPVKWVVGALTDIDDEVNKRQHANEISVQLGMMAKHRNIYEMDLAHDTITNIIRNTDGYTRDDHPMRLSQYINDMLNKNLVDPSFESYYKQWLEKGYLERVTSSGAWETEVLMRYDAGEDFRWHSEKIARIGQTRRFLRVERDVHESHEQRAKNMLIAERAKFSEYNKDMLDVMASLVEFRGITDNTHIFNVRALTKILLDDLIVRSPVYDLTKEDVDRYAEASTLHDIGKIVVPDSILKKEGKLTAEEFALVKTHTTEGAKIIDKLSVPGQEKLMALCKDIALYHHERWDGSGYPKGLKEEEIPIGAQVVGLADVYDSMVSSRVYKGASSHEEVANKIIAGELGAYNPRLIESFKACKDRMVAMYANKK